MQLSAFSRKGGQARSPRKTRANRAKAIAFWQAVRAGEVSAPRRKRLPPTLDEIRRKVPAFCRSHGVTKLEIFGSVARRDVRLGSDVDLIATFRKAPGLRFFTLEAELAKLLNSPVHLLTREAIDSLSNRYRRQSILADAQVIYKER